MILDDAVAHRGHINARKYYERVSLAARRAKHFVFDPRASALIGSFIDQCSDLILKHRQFAKPPYGTTYIEYDASSLYQGQHGKFPDRPEGFDTTVGYLIDGHWVYIVSQKDTKRPVLWPIFYYVGDRGSNDVPKCPFPVMYYGEGVVAMANKISMVVGASTLVRGENMQNIRDQLAADLLDVLNDNQAYWGGNFKLQNELSLELLSECTGDVRNVWAGLLWLQSVPKSVIYSGVPGGIRLAKGKRIPTSSHHIVSIHLKPKAVVRREYLKSTAKRDTPRYHDVRGFWRHKDGLRTGCSHVWPNEPDKHHVFVCERCQRRRWWISPHHRGDKSKGTITKDYTVDVEKKEK